MRPTGISRWESTGYLQKGWGGTNTFVLSLEVLVLFIILDFFHHHWSWDLYREQDQYVHPSGPARLVYELTILCWMLFLYVQCNLAVVRCDARLTQASRTWSKSNNYVHSMQKTLGSEQAGVCASVHWLHLALARLQLAGSNSFSI